MTPKKSLYSELVDCDRTLNQGLRDYLHQNTPMIWNKYSNSFVGTYYDSHPCNKIREILRQHICEDDL